MARKNYCMDQNGNKVTRGIRKEKLPDGRAAWGATVWFGDAPATIIKRNYYDTRKNAEDADIGDEIGKYGRIA